MYSDGPAFGYCWRTFNKPSDTRVQTDIIGGHAVLLHGGPRPYVGTHEDYGEDPSDVNAHGFYDAAQRKWIDASKYRTALLQAYDLAVEMHRELGKVWSACEPSRASLCVRAFLSLSPAPLSLPLSLSRFSLCVSVVNEGAGGRAGHSCHPLTCSASHPRPRGQQRHRACAHIANPQCTSVCALSWQARFTEPRGRATCATCKDAHARSTADFDLCTYDVRVLTKPHL